MSNANNYNFSNKLQHFKEKVLDPQIARVDKAKVIMHDNNYKWRDEDQKKTARAQYESYKAWLSFYQTHYDEGVKLTIQHENLVNLLSKWYDNWYKNISNEGRQETELMGSQADMLQEIFSEIYKELQPLKLEGVKAPAALNLK